MTAFYYDKFDIDIFSVTTVCDSFCTGPTHCRCIVQCYHCTNLPSESKTSGRTSARHGTSSLSRGRNRTERNWAARGVARPAQLSWLVKLGGDFREMLRVPSGLLTL